MLQGLDRKAVCGENRAAAGTEGPEESSCQSEAGVESGQASWERE